MKNIYSFLRKCFYLCFLLGVIACSNTTSTTKWTFLVYLDADNDLASAALADLEEMRLGSKTTEIEIYVQLDLPDGITAKRYLVQNQTITMLSDIGEVNMADGDTLTEFLLWGKSQTSTSSEHTVLILSDHGNGWDQGNGPPSSKPTPASRALFMDWDNGVYNVALHNNKVREAIETAEIDIDILGLDTSIMGTIEVLHEFFLLADILISSQEVGEASGWDYETIFTQLSNNPAMTNEAFSAVVVASYENYFETRFYPLKPPEFDQRYTLAAHRSDGILPIVTALNSMALDFNRELNNENSQDITLNNLTLARQEVQEIDRYVQFDVYMDIVDFSKRLPFDYDLPMLVSNATIAEYHGKGRTDANGISVVFFNPPDAWIYNTCDASYKNWNEQTATGNKGKFINTTSWDEMLAQYYSLVVPSYEEISEDHPCNVLFRKPLEN